jgi:hypothetical protein
MGQRSDVGIEVDARADEVRLAPSVRKSYADLGFFLAPGLFSADEVNCISEEIEGSGQFRPGVTIPEGDGKAVRALYGGQESSPVLQRLIVDARLVVPAMQLLESDVYMYQFKVNMKQSFVGDVWPWHQDFLYWQQLDGMLRPDLINAVLFLDDVTEFNAPLFCIPGSHKAGVYPHESVAEKPATGSSNHQFYVSSSLGFQLTPQHISSLVEQSGLYSAKGPRGSVFFFHPNIVHGSTMNISPFSRRQIFFTYNSIGNALPKASPRPGYFVNSSAAPISPRYGKLRKAD